MRHEGSPSAFTVLESNSNSVSGSLPHWHVRPSQKYPVCRRSCCSRNLTEGDPVVQIFFKDGDFPSADYEIPSLLRNPGFVSGPTRHPH